VTRTHLAGGAIGAAALGLLALYAALTPAEAVAPPILPLPEDEPQPAPGRPRQRRTPWRLPTGVPASLRKALAEIPSLTARDRVLLIGQTGTMKSTLGKALVNREMTSGRWADVWALDPDDELSQLGLRREEVILGPLSRRYTWDEFIDAPAAETSTGALAVVPSKKPREAAAQFAELIEQAETVGDHLIWVEEVGGFSRYAQEALDYAATRSRKWGTAKGSPLILVSQRRVGVPYTAASQATIIVSGLQDMPEDLDALAARCGKDYAERVSRLPPGAFAVWRKQPQPGATPP
jgi:hypothetical protein